MTQSTEELEDKYRQARVRVSNLYARLSATGLLTAEITRKPEYRELVVKRDRAKTKWWRRKRGLDG